MTKHSSKKSNSKSMQNWTAEEIEHLKKLYLDRRSLLQIAIILKRSKSSINKVLTRYNIRPCKKNINMHANSNSMSPEKLLSRNVGQWVSFNTVCQYLKCLGIIIIKDESNSKLTDNELTEQKFVIGHSFVNAPQILMLANKNRFEKQLPPFFVEQLSW